MKKFILLIAWGVTFKMDKRELALNKVNMFISNDWDLKEETPEFFLLTRNQQSTFVHILLLMFCVWWSFGIFNVAYYFMKKEKKKIII